MYKVVMKENIIEKEWKCPAQKKYYYKNKELRRNKCDVPGPRSGRQVFELQTMLE